MMRQLFLVVLFSLWMVVAAFAAVDVNKADPSALASLPGIGPAKAQAIVDYRQAHGPFGAVEDLLQVKGIGPKILEKIKDQIEIGK